jgi:hypothetical protein
VIQLIREHNYIRTACSLLSNFEGKMISPSQALLDGTFLIAVLQQCKMVRKFEAGSYQSCVKADILRPAF